MGAGYNPSAWSAFFSAEVSASAALAGLIFVAVSINLPKIIAQGNLVARSAKALFTLTGILIASTLCLVPGQSEVALGWELVIAGAAIWATTTFSQHSASHDTPYIDRWSRIFHFTLAQLACLPFVVAGISLLFGAGGGLYWLVPATILCIVAALLDAWVLLIEILR
jgi:hypothetical protein